MEPILKFFETLAGYALRWRTRGGYFRVLLVLLAASYQARALLPLNLPQLAVLDIALAFVWAVAWTILSGRLPIARGNTNSVVFAVDVEPDAERNYRRAFQTLKRVAESLPLSERLRVRRIAPDIVQSQPAAERYITNFGVAQVVWGRGLTGHIAEKASEKYELFYTQRTSPNANIEAIAQDVALLFAGRRWTVSELNSLVDVEVLAEDFIEASLAMIGILYVIEDRYRDAAVVFSRVVAGLEAHSGNRAKEIYEAQLSRFRDILHSLETTVALRAHAAGDDATAVNILNRLIPLYPENLNLHLTLARCHFYGGNLDGAIASTREVEKRDPGSPAVYANLAFFAILQKNYKRAAAYYEKLLKSRRDKAAVLPSVSEFLEERYAETPTEHAYLYGMAIVNGAVDSEVLREDLLTFLEVTSAEQQTYAALRVSATALLKQLGA